MFSFNFFSGCLEDPEEGGGGFSSIPEVILDYDLETENFKIYVKSALGDYKYLYIRIRINDTEMIENNTYVHQVKCQKNDFTLITEAAVNLDRIFYTSFSVTVVNDIENNIFLNIIDTTDIQEKEFELARDDLPWKNLLTQKE
jgi:hypothetical protein